MTEPISDEELADLRANLGVLPITRRLIARLDAAEASNATLREALRECLAALREWEDDPDTSGLSLLHVAAATKATEALNDAD